MARINKIVLPDSNDYEINDYRISDSDISTWNAGSSGGFSPVELWSNSSPSSNYTAKTETITTSKNWSLLMIVFALQTSNTSSGATWLVPSAITTRASIAWHGSNNNIFCSREVSFTYSSGSLKVTFTTGHIKSPGTITDGAQYCVPLKIYGLA